VAVRAASLIVASSKSFGDEVAAAMIDRLVHHTEVAGPPKATGIASKTETSAGLPRSPPGNYDYSKDGHSSVAGS